MSPAGGRGEPVERRWADQAIWRRFCALFRPPGRVVMSTRLYSAIPPVLSMGAARGSRSIRLLISRMTPISEPDVRIRAPESPESPQKLLDPRNPRSDARTFLRRLVARSLPRSPVSLQHVQAAEATAQNLSLVVGIGAAMSPSTSRQPQKEVAALDPGPRPDLVTRPCLLRAVLAVLRAARRLFGRLFGVIGAVGRRSRAAEPEEVPVVELSCRSSCCGILVLLEVVHMGPGRRQGISCLGA